MRRAILAMPLVLGSVLSFAVMLLYIPIIARRIRGEERVEVPVHRVVPVDAILPASFFADIDARLHALPRDYR